MELVLDTCALVWAAAAPESLSGTARRLLGDAGNDFLVSSISIWEVALKVRKRKIDLGFPVQELVRRLRSQENVALLPVDVRTWLRNVELPWEHSDPADRTIVAIAELRGVPIVTCDERIASYYDNVIW